MADLHVLQISDSHVATPGAPTSGDLGVSLADGVQLLYGRSTTERLALALTGSRETFAADFVVHTGDVSDDGQPSSYEVTRDLLGELGVPVLVTPGNHDDVAAMESHLFGGMVRSGSVHDAESWRVVLASTKAGTVAQGRCGSPMLEQLDSQIGATDKHVLVAMHHPPLSVCGEEGCGIADAAELLDVLDSHDNVRVVVSGHLHRADELERRGVRYLLAPSTCHQIHHRHPLPDHNTTPTQSGVRTMVLRDDGSVDSGLLWFSERQ